MLRCGTTKCEGYLHIALASSVYGMNGRADTNRDDQVIRKVRVESRKSHVRNESCRYQARKLS
jgi:hypothetical protein